MVLIGLYSTLHLDKNFTYCSWKRHKGRPSLRHSAAHWYFLRVRKWRTRGSNKNHAVALHEPCSFIDLHAMARQSQPPKLPPSSTAPSKLIGTGKGRHNKSSIERNAACSDRSSYNWHSVCCIRITIFWQEYTRLQTAAAFSWYQTL